MRTWLGSIPPSLCTLPSGKLGTLDAFNDPLIDNKDIKKRYRADVLMKSTWPESTRRSTRSLKGSPQIWRELRRNNVSPDQSPGIGEPEETGQVHAGLPSIERWQSRGAASNHRRLRDRLPIIGNQEQDGGTSVQLMFATEMGSTADGAMKVYLRPETAQGIFVNFSRAENRKDEDSLRHRTDRKAFRNEMWPGSLSPHA
jgi:glycyl-tRNA synthetase